MCKCGAPRKLNGTAASVSHSVRKNPKGKGTPQGRVISPLLSNIYLHRFERCATLIASATNQVMSIVRYADDFVILEDKWADGARRTSR